jgi:GTP-binding protein
MKEVHFARAYGPEDTIPPFKGANGKVMPEVAIIGRSNVGKSSLLNHFFGDKSLAKTSSQPGKTQTINVFIADDAVAFVDLPGYGFAKVPKELRAAWGPMIEKYLSGRPQINLVLFLFDLRRDPSPEDVEMLGWLAHFGQEVIIVMTKSDKIVPSLRQKHAEDIIRKLKIEAPVILFTTKEAKGKDALKALMAQKLRSFLGTVA